MQKKQQGLLSYKMPHRVGLVNGFYEGFSCLALAASSAVGSKADTLVELSENMFTKPTLQGILSVGIRGDPFITFAERGRGRVPKSECSKRGCVNLVL